MSTTDTAEFMVPVFLEFGKAVYICQCFESSLCFLLSLVAHEAAEGEDGAFQASWDAKTDQVDARTLRDFADAADILRQASPAYGCRSC